MLQDSTVLPSTPAVVLHAAAAPTRRHTAQEAAAWGVRAASHCQTHQSVWHHAAPTRLHLHAQYCQGHGSTSHNSICQVPCSSAGQDTTPQDPSPNTHRTLEPNTPEGAGDVAVTFPTRVMPAGRVSVKLLAAGEAMVPALILHTSHATKPIQ